MPDSYTLVQHSGFGYGHDPTFRNGLQSKPMTETQAKQVQAAGAMVFDDYTAAETAAMREMYPDGTAAEALVPRAPGVFHPTLRIDGLAVYIPPAAMPTVTLERMVAVGEIDAPLPYLSDTRLAILPRSVTVRYYPTQTGWQVGYVWLAGSALRRDGTPGGRHIEVLAGQLEDPDLPAWIHRFVAANTPTSRPHPPAEPAAQTIAAATTRDLTAGACRRRAAGSAAVMKLVRLYAVIAVPDTFDIVEDADTLLDPTLNGAAVYWTARDGYNGEFDELGADPGCWRTDATFDPCEACTPGPMPGVLVGTNGHDHYVQACDQCQRYSGDLLAAAALAATVGGVVAFHAQADRDDDVDEAEEADGYTEDDGDGVPASAEVRTYSPDDITEAATAVPAGVLIATGTDPWIEVNGEPVTWTGRESSQPDDPAADPPRRREDRS